MVKLRGNLTDKMEANPGKGAFPRWKAMSIGSRISLVVLILIVMIAVFATSWRRTTRLRSSRHAKPRCPVPVRHRRQGPRRAVAYDVRRALLADHRPGRHRLRLVCGSIIGAVAAVARKWVSEVIMRILDVIMSFPGIALAATFVLVFGNSVPSLIFAIGFLYTRRSPASCAPTW